MNNKSFFLKMEPEDSLSLFWNDEDTCIGDAESIFLNDDTEVKFNIEGLQEWADVYMWQVLVPCEAGKISLEEIQGSFDWKNFHKQGIALAIEVKKELPKNVVLKYSAPFEDRSGMIPDELLIDDDERYVKNVLEKILA